MKFLVTGGAGFIGSALVRFLINETEHEVLNIDKLTYAGHLESLSAVENNPRYQFVQADICDADKMNELVNQFPLHAPAELIVFSFDLAASLQDLVRIGLA